jgi:hypothetical protein
MVAEQEKEIGMHVPDYCNVVSKNEYRMKVVYTTTIKQDKQI